MGDCEELYERLAETRERVKDIERSLTEILDDLQKVASSEADLISCLKSHAPDYFSWLDGSPADGLQLNVQLNGDPAAQAGAGPEDCARVRQALIQAASREASLSFQMAEVGAVIRNEVIRLSGLAALCRHYEPERSERVSKETLYPLISKYLSL